MCAGSEAEADGEAQIYHIVTDRKGLLSGKAWQVWNSCIHTLFAHADAQKGCFLLEKPAMGRRGLPGSVSRCIKAAVVLALIVVAWHFAAASGRWSAYVLPAPEKVWQTAKKMWESGELIRHALSSFERVATGFSISFALGFGMSLLSYLFPGALPWYSHLMEAMRHVPPMSLIPLLILWFGIGETPKLIIIVLTSFFPIYMNTLAGLNQCDKRLSEVGALMGFSRVKIFFRILLPGALPSVLAGMRIALGYSWRSIIGAEMVAAFSGLGYMILDAQSMSRSDKVIVGIIVIGTVGFITDRLFGLITRLAAHGRQL